MLILMTLGLAAPAGLWLGAASGRGALPRASTAGFAEILREVPRDLLQEPAQLVMLLACLPIALALLLPDRAAAQLPRGGDPDALRFFLVTAAAACAAAIALTVMLYHGPHTWRYGNPVTWWPPIFLAGMLAARWPQWGDGVAALLAGGLISHSAIAGGTAGPALLRWRPPELVCLDAADPGLTLQAGLATYWHARTMAAASGWQRQVESVDFGDGRPFLWISDPRSMVQQRRAARGTPPPYRFILMTGLDPVAIARIHGRPERVVTCGEISLWIYPDAWDPVDRLIAMADPLIPEALASERHVCTGPGQLIAADGADRGRVVSLPPGRWRIGLHYESASDEVRWRILSDADGSVLHELQLASASRTTEATLGRPGGPTRLRLVVLPGDRASPMLLGMSFGPVNAAPAAACVFPRAAPAPAR
jgi:hypothetical protein